MKNCFVHIIFVLEVLGISSGYNNLLLDVIKRILVKVISLVDATGRGVINLSLFYLFDFHTKRRHTVLVCKAIRLLLDLCRDRDG